MARVRLALCSLVLVSGSLGGEAQAGTAGTLPMVDVPWSLAPGQQPAPSLERNYAALLASTTALEAPMAVRFPEPDAATPPPLAGPVPPDGETPAAYKRSGSFGDQIKAVKWELGGILAYMTVSQIIVTRGVRSFHFQDEGWFGKNTANLGIDKLTHAYNSYLLAEVLQARIKRKTGDPARAALAGAILGAGLELYSEFYDAHKKSSGFSIEDVTANTLGAAFSFLRNTVPGLDEKLDFRLLLIPNSDVFTFKGKRHYEQQRYLLALQPAGFDSLKNSPLRFFELHVGYRATGFTFPQQARGEPLERRLFVGVGLNLNALLLSRPRSGAARAASQVLDYIQVPYTATHFSVTK